MALVTKTIRCAVCGSSDVAFDGKIYHCASCGTDSEVSMPAADLAAVNRIVALGGDNEELTRLRRSQRVFEPLRPQADCDRDYRLWKRAVSRASDWIEH